MDPIEGTPVILWMAEHETPPDLSRTAEFWTINWKVGVSYRRIFRDHLRLCSGWRPSLREIIETMAKLRSGDLVFLGQKRNLPLSTMAVAMQLRRLKVEATVHGFRSAFRDWAAEQSSAPREVAEAALAHVLENKVKAALAPR